MFYYLSSRSHYDLTLFDEGEREREKREKLPYRFATFKDVFQKKNIIFINPGRKEPDCQFDDVRRENQICYLKYFVSFHNKRFLQHIVRQLSTSHSEYYNEREHMNQRKEYFISVIIIIFLYLQYRLSKTSYSNKMNFQSEDEARS